MDENIDETICSWYRRPDLEHACFADNAGVAPTSFCDECSALSGQNHLLGKFKPKSYVHLQDGYAFRKTYAETRRDASICSLCRAVEDSITLSRLYPIGPRPRPIPPDSHISLEPVRGGYRLVGFAVLLDDESQNSDGSSSALDDTNASSSAFRSDPARKGFLSIPSHQGASETLFPTLPYVFSCSLYSHSPDFLDSLERKCSVFCQILYRARS